MFYVVSRQNIALDCGMYARIVSLLPIIILKNMRRKEKLMKKLKVDVEASLGYQANGRLKEEKIEMAKLVIKKFICHNCHEEEDVTDKKIFGQTRTCKKCGSIMLNQY
jgi:hypothetical protein